MDGCVCMAARLAYVQGILLKRWSGEPTQWLWPDAIASNAKHTPATLAILYVLCPSLRSPSPLSQCIGCVSGGCSSAYYYNSRSASCVYCDPGFVAMWSNTLWQCGGQNLCINAANPNAANSFAYEHCSAVDADGYCVLCEQGNTTLCAAAFRPLPSVSPSNGTSPTSAPSRSATATASTTILPTPSPSPTLLAELCSARDRCMGCAPGACDVDGTCDACAPGFVFQRYASSSAVYRTCDGAGLCLPTSNPRVASGEAAYAYAMLSCYWANTGGWCELCSPDGGCDAALAPPSPSPTPSSTPSGTSTLSLGAAPSTTAAPTISPFPTPVGCAASRCVGCAQSCLIDSTCNDNICDGGFTFVFTSYIDFYCAGAVRLHTER